MNYRNTEIRGIDHVGITVPDLEIASKFLEEALGAIALYDNQLRGQPPIGGREPETTLGIAEGSQVIAMRMLRIANGPGIELFEMKVTDPLRKPAQIPSDIGLQHFAIYTDDIEKSAERFQRAGGSLLTNPKEMLGIEKGEGNRFLYARTPWGTIIELLTYPSTSQSEKQTSKRRWTPTN